MHRVLQIDMRNYWNQLNFHSFTVNKDNEIKINLTIVREEGNFILAVYKI